MQSNGGLTDARQLPRQGLHPVRPGRRHRRHGPHRRRRPASTRSSASTWAAPRPTCRTTPASSSASTRPQVAGVRMRAPMLSIHTVAAGGGSILHFDGSRYRVGPGLGGRRSRARLLPPRRPAHRDRRQRPARPHPARLLPAGVRPARRPAAGRARPAGASFAALGRADRRGHRRPARRREQVAAGFLEIAVANMANAIKKISVQRGYDVTRYVLNLRRRRRPARLRGRRRAGHDRGAHPPAGRGAVRLRHGPGRHRSRCASRRSRRR